MQHDILTCLQKIGHLAELCRLLSVFAAEGRVSFGINELIERANQTAGTLYRYPKPKHALEVALLFDMAKLNGNNVVLTELGKSFLKESDTNSFELTQFQKSLLLGLLMDKREVSEQIVRFIRELKREGSNLQNDVRIINWDPGLSLIAQLLQQISILKHNAEMLVLNSEFEADVFGDSKHLTEEELWRILDARKIRAQAAEELVVNEERKRLTSLGRSDLAPLVFRISAIDATAGYDIKSFESDDSPRYIEVKSSVGALVRFEWSNDQRRKAEEEGNSYWIYFVPLSRALPNLLRPVVMIQNPVAKISQGTFKESPSHFIVEKDERVE